MPRSGICPTMRRMPSASLMYSAAPRLSPSTFAGQARAFMTIPMFLPLEDIGLIDCGLYTPRSRTLSRRRGRRLRFRRRRLRELRRRDAHVRLDLAELDRRAAVGPGNHSLERHFHAGDVAVIGIVDLRRDDADRGVDEAHLPHEQP